MESLQSIVKRERWSLLTLEEIHEKMRLNNIPPYMTSRGTSTSVRATIQYCRRFVPPEEKKSEDHPDGSKKKALGQFNTTNTAHILQGMTPINTSATVVDPCAGNGDLLLFALEKLSPARLLGYDCDPTKASEQPLVQTRDTLADPVDYTGMFLIMNPPYLSNVQNRESSNKVHYIRYARDDLYKCYIETMIQLPPMEFIIIVPVNFLCAIRSADCRLRKAFFSIFSVVRVNMFNEQVFADTTYNVVAIHGVFRPGSAPTMPINIYPDGGTITIQYGESWRIGGELYDLPSAPVAVGRAIGATPANLSNLYLKAIDDSTLINLSIREHDGATVYGKVSDRSYAWITLSPLPSIEDQARIAADFNRVFTEWRARYNSLFLTNFRDNGRKRISFELAFKVIGYVILY